MPPKRRKFESTFPAVSSEQKWWNLIRFHFVYHSIYLSPHSLSLSLSFQARIKKIMQLDDDVGRVAASVPIVICIFYLIVYLGSENLMIVSSMLCTSYPPSFYSLIVIHFSSSSRNIFTEHSSKSITVCYV